MTVESATYISGLTPAYPPGSDSISEGDDHIRLIKTVLQGTFPNANAAINGIHTKATAPTSTSAGQLWFDTGNNVLKIRNEADDGWVTLNISPVTDFKLLGSNTVGWILPTADGISGQYLTTDAGGNLDWTSASGDELPSQTGHSGKFLTTDGSSASWETSNSAFGGSAAGYRSFSATKGGTDQTIATGTATKVTWPTAEWDTGACFAEGSDATPSTATSRFICNVAGKYHFYTAIKYTGLAVFDNELRIYKNGSTARYANYFISYDDGENTGKPTMQMEVALDLSVSDYVEVYAHQESGGNLDVDGATNASWFTGHRIE